MGDLGRGKRFGRLRHANNFRFVFLTNKAQDIIIETEEKGLGSHVRYTKVKDDVGICQVKTFCLFN